VAVLKDVEGEEDDDEDLGRDQEVIELDKVDVTPSQKKDSNKQKAIISQEEAKQIQDRVDKEQQEIK
jgi:hypothetical protein